MTRILSIMGSGETTPTMTGIHRELLSRAGGSAVLLDTPYGFQENADDITARALEYFDRSARVKVGVAQLRTAADGPLAIATAVARIRAASWVFAGPGSPSYALRQWAATGVGPLLEDKLARGGIVVLSSAAALTAGVCAVPVYEIYKCGDTPFWLDAMNLLEPYGIRAAVIPHFDNAEGGNHDTRFCYLGERRLQMMEALLPEGVWVLGVDEHTACTFDLDADLFSVTGKGVVTVRVAGHVLGRFASGQTGPIQELRDAAAGRVATLPRSAVVLGDASVDARAIGEVAVAGSVLDVARRIERRALTCLDDRDVSGAVDAILELEEALEDWSSDTSTTDERDRARSILRSLVVRLGELAVAGARDPRDVLGPIVEVALGARRDARTRRDWAQSDELRDALAAAGIEVRDTPTGMEWMLSAG